MPLYCGLLFLLLFSCKQNTKDIDYTTKSSSVDSVFVWISKGRDTNFPDSIRRDNLEKALKNAEVASNDSLKTKYFSRISLAYLRINDATAFRNTNKLAMQLAIKSKDSNVHAEAHWDLAEFHRNNAVKDSAFYHFLEAQKIYAALGNDLNSGRMLFNMAAVQEDVNDHTGSEITTIRAVELLKPLNATKQLYNCFNNLGIVAKGLGEYDKAIENYENALVYLEKINGTSPDEIRILNNIGVVYQEQLQHQKAKAYFNQVLQHDSLFYDHPRLYAMTLNNMAHTKQYLNDTSELPDMFIRAIHIQDSVGDITELSRSHYFLAEYHLSKKDTTSALAHAQNAKTFSQRSSNNKRLLETLKLLSLLDPKKSVAHTQEYIALNESLQQEERTTRNKFARIQFETNEFIEQNELLTRQRQLWIGIAIGLLLLAGSLFVIISQRVKNQKLRFERQQQESNQEIFDLMLAQKKKVEEGKQLEQKRISEELHDSILGQMLGIRLVLTGLNKKTDPESIAQRAELILKLQEAEEEVRTISHELNHASYQKIHNFINSIQDLLKTIEKSADINCHLNYDHDMDWDQLSGDLKINLYRIVQECLQNCVKHAHAKNVTLDFGSIKSNLDINIVDDGKGFNTKKGKRGIGLKNITSRVKKLDGSWDITSAIGEGTSVIIKLPIQSRPTKELSNEQNALIQA